MTHEQTKNDPLLKPFLAATNAAEIERELLHLLEVEAAPVMRQTLQRDARRLQSAPASGVTSVEATADWEDILSSAREELIRQLTRLRAGERTGPIGNFRAYAGAVAYTVWAEHLRRAYPARSMLLNRLRYLLENRTNQRGFGIWDDKSGERWCGFARWQGRIPALETDEKWQRLIADPVTAVGEVVGATNFKSINLAQLLSLIFSWLGQPIEFRHLLEIVGQVLEISDRKESLDASQAAEFSAQAVDPSPSPVETAKWQEYLRWLWKEIATLTLPQRTAFLLHSDVTREFELHGVASMRQIAATLQISAMDIAHLWNELPVPDLVVAKRINLERQQVINLRRIARDRLGAAWKKWIA